MVQIRLERTRLSLVVMTATRSAVIEAYDAESRTTAKRKCRWEAFASGFWLVHGGAIINYEEREAQDD